MPRASFEADRREQEEERAKRHRARRAAQRIAAQRDVIVAREEIERRTRRVEQSVRAKVAYASYVCEQQQQQLARLNGDAGEAGGCASGSGAAGGVSLALTADPSDHNRFLALADDRLRSLAAARQRRDGSAFASGGAGELVAISAAAAGGKLPGAGAIGGAGSGVDGLSLSRGSHQHRLLAPGANAHRLMALGATPPPGAGGKPLARKGSPEQRAAAAALAAGAKPLRSSATAAAAQGMTTGCRAVAAAVEPTTLPAGSPAHTTATTAPEMATGAADGGVNASDGGGSTADRASGPGWLGSLAGLWRELKPPSTRTEQPPPAESQLALPAGEALERRPTAAAVEAPQAVPHRLLALAAQQGVAGSSPILIADVLREEQGEDDAPTDRAVRVEPTTGAARVHRSASPDKQPSAYLAGASTTSADRASMHEASHEAAASATHGAIASASSESALREMTSPALGKAAAVAAAARAPGYGPQAIVAWSDKTWHGRAMSPTFASSKALPGQPLAVRLPGQPSDGERYRPDFGELQEALAIGHDATVVGKDGEQLTLSKWEDEAWGELVRVGSAAHLAHCLERFGVQGEHPHLALDCFAQVRLRCLHRKQASLLESGVPAAVVAAMKAHVENRAVQSLGCECLGLLAGYSASAASSIYALKQQELVATTGDDELAC